MVKVSIVVGDLASTGAGRWFNRTFLLAEALQRRGHEVELLGYTFGERNPDLYQQPYPVYTFAGCNYPLFLRSVWQLHRRISGDVVFALKLRATSIGTALLHKQLTRKPLIIDIDDWELSWVGGASYRYRFSPRQFLRDVLKPNGLLRQPDAPPYLQWAEAQVQRADAVTVHTSFMRDRFGGTYIPNGKNIELFDPDRYDPEASRRKYGLEGYKVLMFPGAPRPYKGVEDVLEALDRLDWPDLRLVVVGGSPYDDYDRQLMEQWPNRMIKLPTFDYSQMPEVVSAAHVLVVPQRETPSTLAQFPLKVTDGMAMAKPIIATRVGDMPEILGEAGFLVAPEAPAEIAQAIAAIFNNWELATERGAQSRQRCCEHYSLERMGESLDAVLTALNR